MSNKEGMNLSAFEKEVMGESNTQTTNDFSSATSKFGITREVIKPTVVEDESIIAQAQKSTLPDNLFTIVEGEEVKTSDLKSNVGHQMKKLVHDNTNPLTDFRQTSNTVDPSRRVLFEKYRAPNEPLVYEQTSIAIERDLFKQYTDAAKLTEAQVYDFVKGIEGTYYLDAENIYNAQVELYRNMFEIDNKFPMQVILNLTGTAHASKATQK